MLSKSESQEKMVNVVAKLKADDGWEDGRIIDDFFDLYENYDFAEKYYVPDEALTSRVAEYERWCGEKREEDPGHLMEELAFLAVRCVRGVEVLKSFQSFAAQHDLVVTGSSPLWMMLMKYLHLDEKHREIVVEAKNESSAISDAQFSRLCGIVQNKFSNCRLGVFVSRQTASGFPSRDQAGQTRQRTLRDARATQALFRAGTNKFVIVLDHEDILSLTKPGSLPRLLESKIRDVDDVSGIPLEYDENWHEVDLPPHLSKYIS